MEENQKIKIGIIGTGRIATFRGVKDTRQQPTNDLSRAHTGS